MQIVVHGHCFGFHCLTGVPESGRSGTTVVVAILCMGGMCGKDYTRIIDMVSIWFLERCVH